MSLSSYPGSGNTWVRYMIEEFTGYYTGSVFHDGKLYRGGFMGEYEEYEDGRVIVTKQHTFRSERPLTDAIMLIRNPYDAFLSEFNRVNHGVGATGNDHTGACLKYKPVFICLKKFLSSHVRTSIARRFHVIEMDRNEFRKICYQMVSAVLRPSWKWAQNASDYL